MLAKHFVMILCSLRLNRMVLNILSHCFVMRCCFCVSFLSLFTFRCTKTRSFENLPSACELGSSLAPNRRSSDPSLNEKWQDHRRSLEVNMAVGPERGGNQDQEVLPYGVGPYPDRADSELEEGPLPQGLLVELGQGSPAATGEEAEEAELSVAVGVAEGQMENILQEATKEEAGADQKEGSAAVKQVINTVDTELEKEAQVEDENECTDVGTEVQTETLSNVHQPENGGLEAEEDDVSPPPPAQTAEELDEQAAEVTQTPEDVETQDVENSSLKEEVAQGPSESGSDEPEQTAAHRTITNSFMDISPEDPAVDEETCPDSESDPGVSEPMEQLEKRASLMESSTETLTEEACSRLELPTQPPVCLGHQPCSDGRSQPPCSRKEKGLEAGEHSFIRTLNEATKRPSVCALQSVSADHSREGLCNLDSSEGEPCGVPHWAKGSGERAPLSRQMSLASCNSLILHPRGSCSHHRCCHSLLSRGAISPEQPSRNHLDDDGLTLHNDVIQQRLRQIEAGHQMEVETLKKQVQELWSRLENQQHTGSHRINGDMENEVVRCQQVDEKLFTTRT